MNKAETLGILQKIKSGDISPEDALSKLCTQPFEDLGYAKLDHHRELRQGVPEVIYGTGKTPEQIIGIAEAMLSNDQHLILITRLSLETAEAIKKTLPLQYHQTARIGIIGEISKPNGIGRIVVATGGTSDIPVAEEAALTAEVLGNSVVRLYDVGVAGMHRLLSKLGDIMDAQVVISIAGMEGALTSVIGGLVDCPVIGVPTSVGYGASFNGIAALLSMLNSCASGVSVVNIDNGFGAGYLASIINHQRGAK
jgi:NCAIR mutase (PurE)-related protein